MCCLEYENDYYVEINKLMPKINSFVETSSGRGIVLYNDLSKQTSQVKIGDENNFEIKTFKLSEIKTKREN
jgi:cell fate regulator YaaT (PSP1 superfamily)